jgi:hypothetical protein
MSSALLVSSGRAFSKKRLLSAVVGSGLALATLVQTGSAAGAADSSTAAGGPTAANAGYWMATDSGLVGSFGGTPSLGQLPFVPTHPVVGISPTPDGQGYREVASDGGVFTFGDAGFFGSAGNVPLAKPVVGMAPTPDGLGYWLVASDGGIFTYGDAGFYGSTGGIRLTQPVVGMAPTPDGHGYWLVASDGGIFTFGDAGFYGSTGGIRLTQPVVGMAPTPDGHGYWLVASDGGIFTFGDAPFMGSASTKASSAVTAMVPAPASDGYWLFGSDGSVYNFGTAAPRGSGAASLPAGQAVVGAALGVGTGADSGSFPAVAAPAPVSDAANSYPSGSTGYDISWPQCGGAYPPPARVAVVGVNSGFAFSTNTCLASESSWGGQNLSLYINLNAPQGSNSSEWSSGPAGNCATTDISCEFYNWGWHAALSSVATAATDSVTTAMWWLDVETGNYWTTNTAANDRVIEGALAALRSQGLTVSIYSTNYQWGQIAGNYVPGVPVWYPTGTATTTPTAWCSTTSFAGGPVSLVQEAAGRFDGDYSC